jgi:hypothetical protein
MYGQDEKHKKFVTKPKGKRSLERDRHEWEENVKINLKGI